MRPQSVYIEVYRRRILIQDRHNQTDTEAMDMQEFEVCDIVVEDVGEVDITHN
jgi:hypothetical protein